MTIPRNRTGLRTARIVAYDTPLREGGSLPAIVRADDGGTWVAKFRAAGQGAGALVAEVVVAHFADAMGLAVPDVVVLDLDRAIGALERDPEIQQLLVESAGANFGMQWLAGAVTWESAAFDVDEHTAAQVRWLDALVGNIDRTWRNPNLLAWREGMWLIDHGAALPWQHGWVRRDHLDDVVARAVQWRVDLGDHVLAGRGDVAAVHPAGRINDDVVGDALAAVPDAWLAATAPDVAVDDIRATHQHILGTRLADAQPWLDTADHPRMDPDVESRRRRRTRPEWLQ